MAGTGKKFDSLRFNRFDNEQLILALLISLAVHLAGFGGYELGKAAQLFPRRNPAAKIKTQPAQPVVQNSDPVEFAFSEQPTPDAPQNAKYYSDKNSRAANPDTSQDAARPKLNGKQTDVPQTHDAPRTQISKAQPQPETQQAKNEVQPSQPKPILQPGDLERPKPQDSQEQKNNSEPRPRTLKEARAQAANLRPSLQMQQDGGVRRQALVSSLDAKETSFGKYDGALIDAVTQRWYDLLDKNGYSFDREGKVVVAFRLHSDGRITDENIVEDTADDKPGGMWAIFCQVSIENAAPFAPWPSDYLHMQGSNYRDLRFQFDYIVP